MKTLRDVRDSGLDMLPFSSVYNVLNYRLGYSKELSKLRVGYNKRCMQLTNSQNFFFRQLGVFVLFSLQWIKSAFCNTISHVFELCSDKQMLRVTAARIIAVMADVLAYRNGSVCKLPRFSMGQAAPIVLPTKCKNPISSLIDFAKKWPAFIRSRFIHSFPEAFRNRHHFIFSPPRKWTSVLRIKRVNVSVWVFEHHGTRIMRLSTSTQGDS